MPKLLLFVCLSLLFALPSHADSVNHVDATASFMDYSNTQRAFDASFDWDIDTQTASNSAVNGSLLDFHTAGNNFANWTMKDGSFQISIKDFQDVGNRITFNSVGTYDATSGGGALEFYGPHGDFGSWNGLAGTLTINPVPEPSSWLMSIAGIMSLLALKRRMV